jgi:spore coat polysaccharide biosynthesis protein SpsF
VTVVAIVQARMSSSRLPGKVLSELAGTPMLRLIVKRVQAAQTVEDVVVAVADEPGAMALVEVASAAGAATSLGSSQDVLDRFVQAARSRHADVIVRITADDPFKDPEVIDRVVSALLTDDSVDYASNTLRPTYPEGLDVECIRSEALERAWREAVLPSEREHVTPYIWNHTERFTVRNVEYQKDLSSRRWTVDYPDDLAFARSVYEAMAPDTMFGMHEMLDLLDRRPDIAALAPHRLRNEGYSVSIDQETRG